MTKEEFEKEAEERARKLEESQTLGVYNTDEELAQDVGWNSGEVSGYEDGFKDGAEFVYNKLNVQLTKAKEIIKDYMTIVKGAHTTVCGVPEENRTIYVLKLNEEAEQFLNGEVEKLIESPVDHIIEQNEKEVSLNPDYFLGGW